MKHLVILATSLLFPLLMRCLVPCHGGRGVTMTATHPLKITAAVDKKSFFGGGQQVPRAPQTRGTNTRGPKPGSEGATRPGEGLYLKSQN